MPLMGSDLRCEAFCDGTIGGKNEEGGRETVRDGTRMTPCCAPEHGEGGEHRVRNPKLTGARGPIARQHFDGENHFSPGRVGAGAGMLNAYQLVSMTKCSRPEKPQE